MCNGGSHGKGFDIVSSSSGEGNGVVWVWCSIFVIVVLQGISYNVGPRYISTDTPYRGSVANRDKPNQHRHLGMDDDYIRVNPWWRHQMEPFSALLALCAGNSPVPVNYPHKGQWRGALMFSLICARINDWVNYREAGDLRRHRRHYDVSVMRWGTITHHSIVKKPLK